MAISSHVNIVLDGRMAAAFRRFCKRKGAVHARDGVRMLIRETPEFRAIEHKAMAEAKGGGNGNGNGDDGQRVGAGAGNGTKADNSADI